MAIEVGVRELRDGTSRYVERAQAGEVITVTKHGKPVARLVPVDLPPEMARLLEEGRVRWTGRKPGFGAPARLRQEGRTAADYVAEGRR